MVRAWDS